MVMIIHNTTTERIFNKGLVNLLEKYLLFIIGIKYLIPSFPSSDDDTLYYQNSTCNKVLEKKTEKKFDIGIFFRK